MSLRRLFHVFDSFESVGFMRGRHSGRSRIAAFFLGCGALLAGANAYSQSAPAPTISVSHSSSPLIAGQSYTTTWSTTNATSVSYNCTANGTGFSGSTTLAVNGRSSDTAQNAWVGYPSTCIWTATGPGGTKTLSETLTTFAAGNSAQFVSQKVPATIGTNQSGGVSVTLKNTGNTTWTPGNYRLGSQNPQDNQIWKTAKRIELDRPVAPGEQKTFSFFISSPATPNTYNFQWRMVKGADEWFGDTTPNAQINVNAANISEGCASRYPPSGVYTGAASGHQVVGNNIDGYEVSPDITREIVHAGLVLPGQSAAIVVTMLDRLPQFTGTTANGVTSSSYASSDCAMRLSLAEPPAITVVRNPSALIPGQSYTTTWNTTNATSVSYNCTAGGTGFNGSATLEANGSSSDVAKSAWVGYPSTCTWTATGLGGTKTVSETVTTVAEFSAPTLTVTRNPSTLVAGQSYTTTWNTTNATSVSYNCTANGTGFNGSATLSANGSSSDVAQNAWAGYPSTCTWTTTGPGGTKTISETLTTAAAVNNAQSTSYGLPTTMTAGRSYPNVSVTMKNTGNTTWTPGSYRLGSQNPQDNQNWVASKRIELDAPVAPGEEKQFLFNVTAPTVPNAYNFQWKMVKGENEWFGDTSPNVVINVNADISESCQSRYPPSGVYTGSASGHQVVGNNIDGYEVSPDITREIVHAGLVLPGQSASIVVTMLDRLPQFTGTTANGITSSSYAGSDCAMRLSLKAPPAPVTPTLTVKRNPSTLVAGQSYTTTWSTTNVTSVSYNCTANGTGFNGSATLSANGSSSDVAKSAWVDYPSTCTWTATGPGGTKTISETLTTIGANAPTLTVTRNPATLVAGQSYTTTWSTTNVTSVSYSCTAGGTGFNGSATLAANGSSSDTAQNTWAGYPSTCTWTATGPGGTKTISETLTTAAAVNNAQSTSYGLSTTMDAGRSYPNVSVTMKNTGNTTWTPGSYRLGSQNPQDNKNWVASKRIELDTPVAPGQEKQFLFNVTAPTVPNAYSFQWKMVKGDNEWFGDPSPNVLVNVNAANISDSCKGMYQPSGVYTGATSGGRIWGNNTDGYTRDSNISMAIVHAGLVLPGQSASIVVTMLDMQSPFTGTTANGITTDSYASSYCAMRLSVKPPAPVAPTLTVKRNPTTLVAGQSYTTTWSTTNATSVSYNCTASGTGFNGSATLAANGSSSDVAQGTWIAYPSKCTWTATGPGGTKTVTETLTTTMVDPPTLTVTRNPTALVAGQSYTTTWSTTNATSVSYSCTAGGTGFNGSETLDVNGSSSDVAQSSWVAYPSICTWTATGPSGTKTISETLTTTTAAEVIPTITVTRSASPLIAGQSYTTTWSTTNATSVSYNCAANGTGFNGSATLAIDGVSVETAQAAWSGYPSTCTWTATGPGGTKTLSEMLTTVAAANNAQFVSQSVPAAMQTNKAYSVSVTLKNTGNTVWTPAEDYKLGAQNPQDNRNWVASKRIPLDVPVFPGEQKTFSFTAIAPATPNTHNFQWKMVKGENTWFGDTTPNVPVNVSATNISEQCLNATPRSGVYTGAASGGQVVGNNTDGYTADSNMSVAIVHAGLVSPGQSTSIVVTMLDTLPQFTGTTANGVTTSSSPNPSCAMRLSVAEGPAPTISVSRNPPTLIAGQSFTTTWSTTDATLVTYNCTGGGTAYSGIAALPPNGSSSGTAKSEWISRPSVCTWIATGPGGTKTISETLFTAAEAIPPTLTVTRNPSTLIAGQSYTTTWSTTNATSVRYNCTANGSGFNGSATLAANGSSSDTAQNSWVGYPSTCTWIASGAGGTKTVSETLTTVAAGVPTITVTRSASPLIAGQSYTTTWSTTNATSVSYNCTALGTGFTGSATLAANGSSTEIANSDWIGYPSTCIWTATGPGGSETFVEGMTTRQAVAAQHMPTPNDNDAQFVSQNVPATMVAGQTYTVSMTLENTGGTTWTTDKAYKLGAQNPTDNVNWVSAKRVQLPSQVAPGEQATFNFSVTAPSTPGTYHFQWQMVQELVEWFGGATPNVEVVVNAPTSNGAQFLAQSVPDEMTAGQSYPVSITLKNTGGTTWKADKAYKLGAQNPTDNVNWVSAKRVQLPSQVAPGEQATFNFSVTAPSTPGTYHFQWQMVQELVEWFGGITPDVEVTVSPPSGNDALFVSQNVPSQMKPGQSYPVAITLKNTGAMTWTSANGYKLGAQNPQDNTLWSNSNRVELTGSVAPGQEYTFGFNVTAPTTPGSYNFQWQMVREFVEWFGSESPNQEITVAWSSDNLKANLTASPTNVRVSGTQTAAITFTGNGADSGNKLVKIELFQDSGNGYGTSPVHTIASPGTSANLALNATVNLEAGFYRFKLRSTDSQNNITESNPIPISITNSALAGTVDGVRINADSVPQLTGWACQDGSAEALAYSLYLNAPTTAMGGTLVASGTASLATDPNNAAIQAACHTQGSGHHFSIDLNAVSTKVSSGIPAGTPLYVQARTSGGASIVLPCGDNNCTMPGSLRIGLTTPLDDDRYPAPATVFMRAKLANGTGPYDEIAFNINGEWITGKPDTEADTYYASKASVPASTTPYPVMAKVRQGSSTLYSMVNQIQVGGTGTSATTLALVNPAGGSTVSPGTSVTLAAAVSGATASVSSVKFYANGALVGTGNNSNGIWSANWSNPQAGSYSITASAFDGNDKPLAQSPAVTLSVNGSGGASSDKPMPVTIELPSGLLDNADAGSLPGSLNVGNDGAATYSMPLAVPPGTGGLTPDLSLYYSSLGGNGILGLGWSLHGLSTIHRCGKTIAQDGMPGRISFDTIDRLCIDGERLVRADGANPGTDVNAIDASYWAARAQYRTERESFTRITHLDNGDFKVESKDGLIHFYSAIAAQGRTDGQPLLWALARTEDRSGNYLTVDYSQNIDNGEYLPTQVRYGGNTATNQAADLAVRFVYEGRGDAQMIYIGGSRNDLRSRLTHIRTYTNTAVDGSGGTLVRDHEVHYTESATSGRSLIDWMRASALNPETGVTEWLPKTTFDWGAGGAPVFKPLPIQPFALPAIGDKQPVRFTGNFDGSGRTSFGAANVTDSGSTYLYLGGKVRIRLPNGSVIDRTLDLAAAGIQKAPADYGMPTIMAGDLDGDGRDDLIVIDRSNNWKWAYCLNTAASGSVDFDCRPGGTGGAPTLVDLRNERKMHLLLPFDVNGNGSDCQIVNGALQCVSLKISGPDEMMSRPDIKYDPVTQIYWGREVYFEPAGINLSQQGMSDFYVRWTTLTRTTMQPAWTKSSTGFAVCYNNQTGLNCQSLSQGLPDSVSAPSLGDLNGDGLTDFAYSQPNWIYPSTGNEVGGPILVNSDVHVCLSKETGVNCWIDDTLSATEDLINSSKVGNFTGDGINRALFAFIPQGSNMNAAKSKLCRYTPSGFSCQDFAYSPAAGAEGQTFFPDDSGIPAFLISSGSNVPGLDPNGVGPWDGTSTQQGTTMQPGYQAVTLRGPAEQDKLIGVTNGVGQREEIDYAYGSDAAVYRRFTVIDGVEQRTTYPKAVVPPPVLAKEVRRGNGRGGWLRKNHSYESALVDGGGRGSLGFAKVRITDSQTSLATVSELSQDYPFTGMVKHAQALGRNGVVLRDTTNQFDKKTITLPSGAQTVFPFVNHIDTVSKDLDGSDLGKATTDNKYEDGWGNLTQQIVRVTGNDNQTYTQSTSSSYNNDSDSWLLGLVNLNSVTKTDPVAGNATRTIGYSYYSGKPLLQSATIEPDTQTYRVLTTYERDSFGLVKKTTQSWFDPDKKQITSRTLSDTTYDAKGRFALSIKNALGHSETRSYDASTGALTSLTGPNLLKTRWTVDGFGRTTKESRADGNETRQYHKLCQGNCPLGAAVVSITDSFHGTDRIAVPQLIYRDSAGHVLRTQTWGFGGRTIVADQRYDERGRLSEVDQPRYDGDTAYLLYRQSYDDKDRITSVTTLGESGSEQNAITEYQGMTKADRNAKSQYRFTTHDVLGRVVQVMDAKGGVTRFGYDPFGNVNSTTDPKGNTIRVNYDRLGRKTDLKDPDLGWIHYDVDPLGQTWKKISPMQRANTQFTRYEYDLLGRLTGRYEPDLESHWVYDTAVNGIGKLAEAYTGTALAKDYRRLHTYDNLGRTSSTTQVLFDGSYTSQLNYDAWGRVIRQTYRRGNDAAKVFDTRYNSNGYLARIERSGLVLSQVIAQDAAQRPTQVLLGNGLTQTRSYDARTGRIDHVLLHTAGHVRRLEESYQYDALGNVAQRSQDWTAGGFLENFSYDELNRLTSSQVLGQSAPQVMGYDEVGNLKSKTGIGAYVYPTQPINDLALGNVVRRPHAVESIQGSSFKYDDNGNLTTGAGRSLTWKSFDMPGTITKGTLKAAFVYGPEHQRTRQTRIVNDKVVGETVYAGVQEVENNGGQITVKTYWPNGVGVEIDRPNGVTELNWVHADRLGSPIALTGSDGNLTERLAYDPWGKRRKLDGSDVPDNLDGQVDNKGFTGHEMLDQLDLVHMNGRVYDPAIGVFVSADPLISDPANGQDHNRYSYAWNNPVNVIDPTGFEEGLPEVVVKAPRWSDSTSNNWNWTVFDFRPQQSLFNLDLTAAKAAAGNSVVSREANGGNDGQKINSRILQAMSHKKQPGEYGYIPGAEESLPMPTEELAVNVLTAGEGVPTLLKLGSKLLAKIGLFFGKEATTEATLGAKGAGTTAEQILNAERIGSGLKADASHRAASFLSKEQLQAGQVFPLRGGDGVERTLLQTPGGLNGKNGIYEYIYDSAGKVTHQRFIDGGTVTGLPNQRVPKVP